MIRINRNRMIGKEEFVEILKEFNLYNPLTEARRISIKPNFSAGSYISPASHVVTDLKLLKNIVQLILEINPGTMIYIAESDSTGNDFAYLKFEHLNLPDSLELEEDERDRVFLLDLSRDRLERIENREFKFFNTLDKQLWVSKEFLDSDMIISLSNLKTHLATRYTGACKNLFGCLPVTEKSVYHPKIHSVIHDLVLAVKPELNIVDAFYGMEENGPVRGIPKDSGFRIISNDPVEADCYAAKFIGLDPKKIEYLKLLLKTAKKDGPGIKLDGEPDSYKKPQLFLRIMNSSGFFVQKTGQGISDFGHRMHLCSNFRILGITIVRPVLLKFFDYEKLRILRKKIMK